MCNKWRQTKTDVELFPIPDHNHFHHSHGEHNHSRHNHERTPGDGSKSIAIGEALCSAG